MARFLLAGILGEKAGDPRGTEGKPDANEITIHSWNVKPMRRGCADPAHRSDTKTVTPPPQLTDRSATFACASGQRVLDRRHVTAGRSAPQPPKVHSSNVNSTTLNAGCRPVTGRDCLRVAGRSAGPARMHRPQDHTAGTAADRTGARPTREAATTCHATAPRPARARIRTVPGPTTPTRCPGPPRAPNTTGRRMTGCAREPGGAMHPAEAAAPGRRSARGRGLPRAGPQPRNPSAPVIRIYRQRSRSAR
ncbi:hypothetical protein J2Z21_000421 [Streptomyces griseochromogenes]|uniref:Endonuclease/exonuclease/phosphatase domain-containing protein n=1 Tax=Streptomyces griseochromogenes TaxID=68214 RepID=A0ABS4LJD9_9ACTN|nr:hypothetical protein [Streptomyces griseochromogenes]